MLEKLKKRLLEMEAEAQRLAEQDDLSQTDMDKIVELKREQEEIVAQLDARDKLSVLRSLTGRLADDAPTSDPVDGGEGRNSAAQSVKWDEGRTLEFFQAVKRNDGAAAARILEARDPNTIVGPDGGYLVPDPVSMGLNQKMVEASILAGKCQGVPITVGNSTKWNALVQDNMGESTAFGGVQAYWVSEGGSITASQPEFEQITMDLQKLTALVTPTEEQLADAPQFAAFINSIVPRALAYKLDGAIFEGDGAGKPLGYHSTSNPALVTIAKESGQAADTLLIQNIFKMYARMPGYLMGGAEWHINQDVIPQLLGLNSDSTNGIPVYMPANNLSQSPFGSLLGRPLQFTPHNATLGDKGDITFVNLSEYLLASKGGLRTDNSIHVYFTTDKEAFRFIRRVDGKPGWKSAVTPKKGSNTLSPFITLAARA